MSEIHTHCDGCDLPIVEDEEDIIEIHKGKAQLMESVMTLSTLDNAVWYGHAKCYEESLKNAEVFLQGVVYHELNRLLRMDLLKGRLENIFKNNGWPRGRI